MSAWLTGIKCPICGESVSAPCRLSGGDPGDYWTPPSGPDVDWDVTEFEPNCECSIQIEVEAPKIRRLVYEPNRKKHEQIREVLARYTPHLNRAVGFHKRQQIMNNMINSLAGVQDRVAKRAPDGSYIYEDAQPLLEAYNEALDEQAQNAPYEYEPDEPDYDPDDRYDRMAWDRGAY